MSQVILKPRHSLRGKNLTPIALRLRVFDGPSPDNLARLKKEHSLEDYTLEELDSEFFQLTGEAVKDILLLAGKDFDLPVVRLLLHFAILHANEVGGPKKVTPAAAIVLDNGSSGAGASTQGKSVESEREGRGTIESRLKAMEKSVQDIKNKSDEVEDALRQENVFTSKKQKFIPCIPEWEIQTGFDPGCIMFGKRKEVHWLNFRGEVLQPSPLAPRAEDVLSCNGNFSLEMLPLRDPNNFVPGLLHNHFEQWEALNPNEEVKQWIRNKIDVTKFFKHFKGNFRGKSFNSPTPPQMYIPNASVCKRFPDFIIQTLTERILNGSIKVLGKVGECDPPHLVLPLTVEPSKPRLCHDERFLNLWIKDSPFQLDTLKEVPRIVTEGSCMTSVDDKSGYDHLLLEENSRKYFGIQFGGWYMLYNTLPFGFKASAYIYHNVGLVATGYCRELGVPCLQYIDDRFIGEIQLKGVLADPSKRSETALYIVCEILTRLGYTLGLKKCAFCPSQTLKFLGMLVDSRKMAFILPNEKKLSFCALREHILNTGEIDVKCLQRFTGKCISFVLAVPAAKLYTVECNRAIGIGVKCSRGIPIEGALREELEHWRFLDNWEGHIPWRDEKHLQITIATDASKFKWGAVIDLGEQNIPLGDFWDTGDDRPIHIKEGEALLRAMKSVVSQVRNHRVDAYVDNMALVGTWQNQGRKDPSLNKLTKVLYEFTAFNNVDLKLHYIPSRENPADAPSRSFSYLDCKLSKTSWDLIQSVFGPHTCDLMSLDSNAMCDTTGKMLRHFTPFPTPLSDGVNVFAQDVEIEENPYVYPPFSLITPLLGFLKERKVVCEIEESPSGNERYIGPAQGSQSGESRGAESLWHISNMDKRLRYLDSLVDNTAYVKQKTALEKEFSDFLCRFSPRKGIVTASPEDVRRFLVYKDRKGKTAVHVVTCPNVGRHGKADCNCPRRLSAGSVQSLIGKLKAIFGKYGMPAHDTQLGKDSRNPASSALVKKYLVSVQREQANSHILPKQAKPLFLGKIEKISVFISERLRGSDLESIDRFVLLRDQAFLKLQFFAGDRAGELGKILIQEVRRLSDDSGLIFSRTVGKTLCNGKENTFAIKRVKNATVCPVTALDEYVNSASLLGIDMRTGYLFRLLDSSRKCVLREPLTYSAVYSRLEFYLNTLGINEGETPHSLRRGCAVTLSLSGEVDKAEKIMGHIGWFTKESLHRYNNMASMLDTGSVSSLFASVVEHGEEMEKVYNVLGNIEALPFAWE